MTCVIIEGPDGAGKTTLIKWLAPVMGAHVVHNGAYIGEVDIAHHYEEQLKSVGITPLIMDRSWFAEPIYGVAMRGGANRISSSERDNLEYLARDIGAVIVLCLPPFSVCRRAWAVRYLEGKEYLDREDKLRRVYDGYRVMSSGTLAMRSYDYTTDKQEDVLEWITTGRD